MVAKVLVVATSRKTRGGITSVVKAHETGEQWKNTIVDGFRLIEMGQHGEKSGTSLQRCLNIGYCYHGMI